MRLLFWNEEKNDLLKADLHRNIGFEDISRAMERGGLLDDVPNPNQAKYPGQGMLVVWAKNYVYSVPYVRVPDGLFLKTIYPNRRLMARYRHMVGS